LDAGDEIKIQYSAPENPPAKIKDTRAIAWKVDVGDYDTVMDEGEDTTTSMAPVTKVWKNFNLDGGDYLLIASADVTGTSTDSSVLVHTSIDGVSQGDFSREPTIANEYYSYIMHRKISLPAGLHNISIEFWSSDGTTVKIKNARITVVKLQSGMFEYAKSETGSSSSSASYDDKVKLQITPSSPGEYLIIASALVKHGCCCDALLYSRLNIDDTDYTEQVYRYKDCSDKIPFFAIKKVNFTSSVHNIKIQYYKEGGHTAYIEKARIIAIRLSPEYSGIGITANSTNVSYQGKLRSINATVRFKSNVSTFYQLMIYNFNTSMWESGGCDGKTVTEDKWEEFWCHKMSNPENYISPEDKKIRVAFGTLDTGLVGEWKFDEGSGDTAHDSSGHGNDGTRYNFANGWVSGKYGNALEFDGSDDYVSVDDNDQQLALDAFTFEAWIKVLSGWSNYDRIVSKKGSLSWNAASGWSLEINTGGMMTFLGSGGTYGDRLSMGWQQDTWHHVAITKEAGATVVKGYLDGQYKDDQSCNTISPNTQPLTLAFYPNENSYTPIIIDQVRIYNRSLSPEEIKASYETGSAQIKNLNIKPQSQPVKAEIDFIQFYVNSASGNYYFRKKFTIEDLSKINNTRIHVLSDDRAEIYLNGNLVDNDTSKHNAKYWNREIDINPNYLNSGDNIIAVKLHNYDSMSAKFDLELTALSERKGFIVVMSDGIAGRHCGNCTYGGDCNCTGTCGNTSGTLECGGLMSDCNGNQCDTAINDAICSSSMVHNISGTIVYSIGIGPITVGCPNAQRTMQYIANCGGGKYCGSANPEEVRECYIEIARDILKITHKAQTLEVAGNISLDNILYPDSYIKLYYSPITALEYGEVSLTFESQAFDNNITTGNFTIPNGTRPVDAIITSYSAAYWTDRLNVSNATGDWKKVYWLGDYGTDYIPLGDPYIVHIPANLLSVGINNVRIATGVTPMDCRGGSPDDKAIYTIAMETSIGYGKPMPKREGCNWLVEFSDNSTSTISVPSGYTGSENCNYTNGSISYNNQSAINDAIYRLFKQLDVSPRDGRLDIKFNPEHIKADVSLVGGVRSLWGPTEVKLVVWMR